MNVASCGLGINSIAGIMEASDRGIVFDEILFANTGIGRKNGERLVTYDYLYKYFNPWLKNHGQPMVKVLNTRDKNGKLMSLYDDVYSKGTLPAIVFGFKTCSQKFKGQTQNKYLNNNELARLTNERGEKVVKWIFYDSDEPGRAKDYSDDKYQIRYFLIEINWGRYECEEKIKQSDLPLPHKSSCKFCPSLKPFEIIDLYNTERQGFYEAIELERNALRSGVLTNVKGLGRDWAWWDLIVAYRYFSLFKSNAIHGSVMNKRIMSNIKRGNRSKPNKLKPRKNKEIDSPTDMVCDLFSVRQDMPCGCYDG